MLNAAFYIVVLSAIILNVTFFLSCEAECHYAECHYVECCGAQT
jgi:hypothetical protein